MFVIGDTVPKRCRSAGRDRVFRYRFVIKLGANVEAVAVSLGVWGDRPA